MIVAGPWPSVVFRLIQPPPSARADHEHSRAVPIVSVPVPPAAGSDGELFVTFVVHLDADGPVTLVVDELPQLFAKCTSTPSTINLRALAARDFPSNIRMALAAWRVLAANGGPCA